MEVEDAEAALTWEALQSVDSDDHDAMGAHDAPHGGGMDADAFPPLDELPAFAEAATHKPLARSKRKNFSKHLQLLCLQRYAAHARAHGALPDRGACQLLLLESFAQFVREGGSEAHPRLAHAEFLKLVRNRSAERQRRLRTSASNTTDAFSSDGRLRRNKRKLVDAYEAKIDALVEEIDRVRRPAAAETDAESSNALTTSVDGIVGTILRLQQDTQRLQREMHERLARLQDQCDQQEPSSASV